MPNKISERLRLALALICALACGTAWALGDVVDRPSVLSDRAPQSLLLAVTRAGGRLVAAGERGIVLLSDDSGKSWRQTPVPVSVTLTSVHFVDAKLGWITGHSGVLLHTTDGGASWSKTLDGVEVARIVFDAEQAKGAAADPAALEDAKRLVADGPDKPLLDSCFLSHQVGFVVGAYGLFLRTEDGGKTWLPWHAHLQNLRGRHLTRMASINGGLYLVGEQGIAYLSADGGKTFEELKSPYRGTFFGVIGLNDGDVVIHGLRGNAFRVGGHGRQWTKLASPDAVTYATSTRLTAGQAIIASQTGDLVRMDDEGRSLVPVAPPIHSLATAIAEANDGALIVTGRGIARVVVNGGGSR